MNDLFTPIKLGSLELENRIFMAPLTRCRAVEGRVPNAELSGLYYSQRASAGLIISEASQISPQGVGYINTPGIHSQEQVAGWKKITDQVHDAGGKIFLQLWHVGRVSHPDFHDGELPVAPSAIGFDGKSYTPEGFKPTVVPRALELHEIKGIVEDYRKASANAKTAGFDGVEVHGANTYLPHQFLSEVSNKREDEYGGSIEKRARFLLEVVDAAIDVWGAERVGVRLSPEASLGGALKESDPKATYGYVLKEFNKRNVAYVHMVGTWAPTEGFSEMERFMREAFDGVLILNGAYTYEKGMRAIQEGVADVVAYGRPFLANPDLPKRFKHNGPLNEPDSNTFYTNDAKGYTDYPFWEKEVIA